MSETEREMLDYMRNQSDFELKILELHKDRNLILAEIRDELRRLRITGIQP